MGAAEAEVKEGRQGGSPGWSYKAACPAPAQDSGLKAGLGSQVPGRPGREGPGGVRDPQRWGPGRGCASRSLSFLLCEEKP